MERSGPGGPYPLGASSVQSQHSTVNAVCENVGRPTLLGQSATETGLRAGVGFKGKERFPPASSPPEEQAPGWRGLGWRRQARAGS